MPFCDAHAHSLARREGVLRVRNLSPEEWGQAQSFAPFCAGIHPWELDGEMPLARLEALEELLKTPGAVALGECGLDRFAKAPLEPQAALFLKQAEMAERLKLPLVIHCVRAFPEIIAARKSLKPESTWIIHGFRGNAQTAKELARHGFMLSFGAALLQKTASLSDALKAVPPEKLLLESDEAQEPIEQVYEAAAKIAGIKPAIVAENFARAFKIQVQA